MLIYCFEPRVYDVFCYASDPDLSKLQLHFVFMTKGISVVFIAKKPIVFLVSLSKLEFVNILTLWGWQLEIHSSGGMTLLVCQIFGSGPINLFITFWDITHHGVEDEKVFIIPSYRLSVEFRTNSPPPANTPTPLLDSFLEKGGGAVREWKLKNPWATQTHSQTQDGLKIHLSYPLEVQWFSSQFWSNFVDCGLKSEVFQLRKPPI